MTIEEYLDAVEELSEGEVEKTEDLLFWQTNFYPTKICVNWAKHKLWLEANESKIEADDDIEFYVFQCAEFGVWDCADKDKLNDLIKALTDENNPLIINSIDFMD